MTTSGSSTYARTTFSATAFMLSAHQRRVVPFFGIMVRLHSGSSKGAGRRCVACASGRNRRDADGKPKPGFLVCDVIIGDHEISERAVKPLSLHFVGQKERLQTISLKTLFPAELIRTRPAARSSWSAQSSDASREVGPPK